MADDIRSTEYDRRVVSHSEFADFRDEIRRELSLLRDDLKAGKKPLADYAPVGLLLIALGGAVLAPLYASTTALRNDVERIDVIEYQSAETRGRHAEKFSTIELAIESALENRHAEFDRVDAEIATNREHIKHVTETLDKGLSDRVRQLIEPLRVELRHMDKESD